MNLVQQDDWPKRRSPRNVWRCSFSGGYWFDRQGFICNQHNNIQTWKNRTNKSTFHVKYRWFIFYIYLKQKLLFLQPIARIVCFFCGLGVFCFSNTNTIYYKRHFKKNEYIRKDFVVKNSQNRTSFLYFDFFRCPRKSVKVILKSICHWSVCKSGLRASKPALPSLVFVILIQNWQK